MHLLEWSQISKCRQQQTREETEWIINSVDHVALKVVYSIGSKNNQLTVCQKVYFMGFLIGFHIKITQI